MRIVVLDAYTINPGDLSWKDLEDLGQCTIYDRTAPNEVFNRAKDAAIVLTNKTFLDKHTIESLPLLRYVGVIATGYNVVSIEAAKPRKIVVTNVPAYGTPSVVQATFALLLELTNQVGYHDRTVHEGHWNNSIDFCYWDRPLIELSGLTMGIIGFGTIGKAVANIARAFGMKVLVHTREQENSQRLSEPEFCDLEDIFARSDVLTLHCALTPDTHQLVNAERLSLMKSSAFLLNTGRGPIIDETALAQALDSGQIAGAGLDVLSVEPPSNGNPLLNCRNCIITPHIAWATLAARKRLLDSAIHNVRAYLDGHPVNTVNEI